jgi:hypothetical protein
MRLDYIGHVRSALVAARDLFVMTGAPPDWADFCGDHDLAGPLIFGDVASAIGLSRSLSE